MPGNNKMASHQPPITPEMKIGDLLDAYPQLEKTLIELAPAFRKLKNPILRKTVARVTSIRQAARVGSIPVADMVNKLRSAAGQSFLEIDAAHMPPEKNSLPSDGSWIETHTIYKSLDARSMIEAGQQPLGKVMADLRNIPTGQIYELITPFEPAPLIDHARSRGFQIITRQEAEGKFKSYFKHDDN